MRKRGGSSRLKDNHVGTSFGRGLDVVEQLLTLDDAVILRVDDFEIRSHPGGRLASALHLFDLEIVVVVGYREQERSLAIIRGPSTVQQNDSPNSARWGVTSVTAAFPMLLTWTRMSRRAFVLKTIGGTVAPKEQALSGNGRLTAIDDGFAGNQKEPLAARILFN